MNSPSEPQPFNILNPFETGAPCIVVQDMARVATALEALVALVAQEAAQVAPAAPATAHATRKLPFPALPDDVEYNVFILYANWRNEVAVRRVAPTGMRFGIEPPYHMEREWLLEAFDIEKQAVRTFALSRVLAWAPDLQGLHQWVRNVGDAKALYVAQTRQFTLLP